MTAMNPSMFVGLFLLSSAVAHAATPVSSAERYARRCQGQVVYRNNTPQGTMLWGTMRDWRTAKVTDERSSVLVSADLEPPLQADARVKALRLEGGHLVAVPAIPQETRASITRHVIGTVLQGTSSDGEPVEVAICGAEPSEDPEVIWYRIEAWNPVAQEWENPCVAVDRFPDPRALVVSGVWDANGAHRDVAGKLTFACENGVITKCIRWGYKPWTSIKGQPLASLHQACTRMARADYCGNGRSHTHQGTIIDIYDQLGMLERTTESSPDWDPRQASFEAAWTPDGASCLARTRDGRAVESILQECPNRFQTGVAVDLGQGDRCTVRRADIRPEAAPLRNLSYGTPGGAASHGEGS